MLARKAAPLAAMAAAAILAGCAVEPAPYHDYDEVYAYSGPSAVFVDPCCDGFYRHYDYDHHDYHHFGGGFHGAGMHGRG
jgi:hypothetical protein